MENFKADNNQFQIGPLVARNGKEILGLYRK